MQYVVGFFNSAESAYGVLTAVFSPGPTEFCFQVELSPFKGSDGKVHGKGSGMATIRIDRQRGTYTRTIVFADLSLPTDAKFVHDPLMMDLPGFPVSVRSGTYTQTFVTNPIHDDFFKDLDFLALNANDILQGNVYSLCKEASSSKSLRGKA